MKYLAFLVLLTTVSCSYTGLTNKFNIGDCVTGGSFFNFSYKIINIDNDRYVVQDDLNIISSLSFGYINRNYAKVDCSLIKGE